jgi:hypothetical protein
MTSAPELDPAGLEAAASRVCNICGDALVRSASSGYEHAGGEGRRRHLAVPVRRKDAGIPIFDRPDSGRKRASGAAGLFTRGDGR